jgi:hypothetical protein
LGLADVLVHVGGVGERGVAPVLEFAERAFELADELVGLFGGQLAGADPHREGDLVVEHDLEACFEALADLVALEFDGKTTKAADGAGPDLVVAVADDVMDGVPDPGKQGGAGVDPFGVAGAVDLYGEAVASGVDAAADGLVVERGFGPPTGRFGAGGVDGLGEAVLFEAVGAGEAFQLGELDLDAASSMTRGLPVARALTSA